MGNMLALLSRGGSVILLLFMTYFMVTLPLGTPAEAAEAEVEARSCVEVYLVSGGVGGFVILLLGLAVVGILAAGLTRGRREGAWSHYGTLVRMLGEAAFLIAILSAVTGLVSAFRVVSLKGAAVTPADFAGGMGQALSVVVVGGWVALIALIGSGVLTMRR